MSHSLLSLNKMGTVRSNQGFSLMELMIALTIGLFVSMAVYSVVSVSEGRKRTTTSMNDIDQAGAYAIYQIDQALRNAGAGLGEKTAYGCPLHAAYKGAQILPSNSFPAPFNSVGTDVRLIPAIIVENAAGNGGDVILTMSGAGGLAEVATPFVASGSTNTVMNLRNVVAFTANDAALLVKTNSTPCFVSQVSNAFVPAVSETKVPLAGDYYSATINGKIITDANAFALNIGKTPNFNMLGIGANNTLFTYNLLLPANTNSNPLPFIENTYMLKAVYGVTASDTSSDISWVKPSGNYAFANLIADPKKLASIRAIKLALILQTNLAEKEAVSANTITVFSDTPIPTEINIQQKNFRYQTFETTIPLRNNLFEVVN